MVKLDVVYTSCLVKTMFLTLIYQFFCFDTRKYPYFIKLSKGRSQLLQTNIEREKIM